MAEHLNEYFSSAFIREDIRSLPATEVKFVGRESNYFNLEQPIVTLIMVSKKVRNIKDN